jgi:crotonobetainyl-CoA:carnitine CoA-transferase CaiB-like acyl-CoA transferase
VLSGAPVYGEHTRDVLAEYGFDPKQIEALEKEGAIVLASGRREERVA